MNKIKKWWITSKEEEKVSPDSILEPLTKNQRRATLPLISVSFGWAFLMLGMIVGESIAPAKSVSDIIISILVGNGLLFIICFLAGFVAYKTGCNTALIYRLVFGNRGMILPCIIVMVVGVGWQASIVGMFAEIWVGPEVTPAYFAIALIGGLLVMLACVKGIQALEIISWPALFCLLIVAAIAIVSSFNVIGGFGGVDLAAKKLYLTEQSTIPMKINLIIGSWIVGALFVGDFTRFAKHRKAVVGFVAINFLFVQPVLHTMGVLGGLAHGSYNPAIYLAASGSVLWFFILISFVLAIFTTADNNLYFTQTPLSNTLKIPRKASVIILGTIGAFAAAFGMLNYVGAFINILALIVPPILGPVVVDFYIIHKRNYDVSLLDKLPAVNVPAIAAYILGVIISVLYTPSWLPMGIMGIIASSFSYALIALIYIRLGRKFGYMVVAETIEVIGHKEIQVNKV